MHWMGPPLNYENSPERKKPLWISIPGDVVRSIGNLARLLAGKDKISEEKKSAISNFEVTADPLHYRSEAGQHEVDAGRGLTGEDTIGIMRDAERPQDPQNN